MKMRRVLISLLIASAGATLLFVIHAQQAAHSTAAAPDRCVLLTFDAAERGWEGRVEVRGGRLAGIEGWRFGPQDSVKPDGSWRISPAPRLTPAREVWPGAACALEDDSLHYYNRHPSPEAGVLVFVEGGTARLAVQTSNGNFEIGVTDPRLGRSVALLDGKAQAQLVPASFRVDNQSPEQDYPSLATAPDGSLWLAYQSYNAARHEDRILLARSWGEPQDVAGPGNFHRPQVAIDGQGRVWVVWSALVNEDWELFGRYLANGSWSETQRITSAPGGDFNQRLAAGPDGRLWLAWQGNRGGNWDIFLSHLEGTQWTAPETVSSAPENDWDPALAVAKDGRVIVAWDRHRRGSYNVYMRILSGGRWQPEMPVASGENYEAHASLAVDSEGKIWIAWDDGGPAWGLDSACNGLYRQRHIDLRVFAGGAWRMPMVKPMRDLPPSMTRFVSLPQVAIDAQGRVWLFFRHWANRAVYQFYAMYLTGTGWSEPVMIPNSTGREHQSIATALGTDGRLWAAWPSDASEPRRQREKHYLIEAAAMPSEIAAGPEAPLQRGTPPLDITVALPREPERYTTSVGGRRLSVYWGDMHRHTDISSHRFTDGSIEDTYRYGSDVARLDFLAPTDHVAPGTATVENIQGDDYHWWRVQKAADLFSRAGVFIPIYAYERSMQSPGGHRNVLHLKRGGVPIRGNIKDPQDNLPMPLWERLRGQEVLVFPHTPADVMQPLIRWDYKNPDFEPLIEIYQGLRSSYEYRNATPDGRLGNTQTDEAGHFYQDALAKGLRYGVEASSDHLATHINYTGVYCEELSRPALFRALKARHTFAASDKITIDFRMGGHLMGDEFRAAPPPAAEVKVIGTARIRRIELVRNNQVVYTHGPSPEQVQFRYQDAQPPAGEAYYYVRVIQEDGNMAWSSPIWVMP
jgi:hypothetical protein